VNINIGVYFCFVVVVDAASIFSVCFLLLFLIIILLIILFVLALFSESAVVVVLVLLGLPTSRPRSYHPRSFVVVAIGGGSPRYIFRSLDEKHAVFDRAGSNATEIATTTIMDENQ
jgi:hypothetical protein